jgi:pyruvyl transferase EpsI
MVHAYLKYKDILRMLRCLYKICLKGNSCKYILINTPEHGNLGDHAIALAERQFLDALVGADDYVEITANEMNGLECKIAKYIPKNKVILIQGGGFLGDIWFEEEMRIHRILQAFSMHKTIIFPQTITYNLSSDYGRKLLKAAQNCYSAHNNLIVFVREQKSEQFMKEYFSSVCTYLIPDMVLMYEHKVKSSVRNGVLFCIRADKEQKLRKKDCTYIEEHIARKFGKDNIKYTDTVLGYSIRQREREMELLHKLQEFANAKLVVTDRLHGMIFAAITGTPCIAFGNTSGKVQGVYEWIKHLDYVKYVEKTELLEAVLGSIDLENVYDYKIEKDKFTLLRNTLE